jgi:NAD+ synthase (glutamine-hydrolysing)
MKISLAQLNYTIGDFEGNEQKMKKAIQQARKDGADIICFAELASCGYPPRDFLEFDDFIRRADKVIDALKKESHDIAIVVGSPSVNPVIEGKDLFNSVYFLYQGESQLVQHKTLLPTYDIFDEYRYFEPNQEFSIIEFKGKRIALTVCEDLWNLGNENPLYTICPMDEMMVQQPDLMINVSASPFDYDQSEKRLHVLKENVDRYKLPLFYVNHIGANTEIIFDGGSTVFSPNGKVFCEMDYFRSYVKTFDLDEVLQNGEDKRLHISKMEKIHDALVLGVRDYFGKLGFTKAIIGLSGGLDSALTAVLTVRALGKENVRVLLMPSEFSSDHSVKDAEDLAKNLGIEYNIIPIKKIYDVYNESLSPYFKGTHFNVAEENLQARARGNLLMAMSNKFGHILLNTTNKSEMAVGYGTLYGDLAGGISVIGDVYKTEVFELGYYINQEKEIIPINTLTKPPSAELRPNQKDSDSLPEYDILDKILYEYIENELGPYEIIDLGYDEKLVKRILRMVNINEFKRYQTAPVLRVSSKAFGIGRRVPIVARYLS